MRIEVVSLGVVIGGRGDNNKVSTGVGFVFVDRGLEVEIFVLQKVVNLGTTSLCCASSMALDNPT
jgi:hypothetical protein